MDEILVRKYKIGDEKQIIKLFHNVYKTHMGKDECINHWNWEYKNNPNNRIEVLLAFKNEKIISHYAVIPVRMKIGNKNYIGSFSIDTMTHNDYRGKGLFPILANHLYKTIGESGIPITCGFPNANSIKVFLNKLSWIKISNTSIYFKPLNFCSLIQYFIKNNFLSKIIGNLMNYIFNFFFEKKKKYSEILKIERLFEFGKEVDEIWELNKKNINIGVIRDKKYLNWRYFLIPDTIYIVFGLKHQNVMKGYIILKIMNRLNTKIGYIIDILTDSRNHLYADYLINYSIQYFKQQKVDIICVMISHYSYYFRFFKKYKFLKLLKLFIPEGYFGVRRNNNEIDIEFLKNPKNWHFTWGDTDYI